MFYFERRITVKTVADMPAAVQFAIAVTSYLNKRHSLKMKTGVELFGHANLCWYFDTESLDKLTQLNATLMQDREYIQMLDRVKGLWVEGSVKDTIVTLLG
jgi:hypothetical protein